MSKQHPLYLHSVCHIRAPQFLHIGGGNFTVVCAAPECYEILLSGKGELVAMDGAPWEIDPETRLFNQECHPNDAVVLAYYASTGRLEIECHYCKAVVGAVQL